MIEQTLDLEPVLNDFIWNGIRLGDRSDVRASILLPGDGVLAPRASSGPTPPTHLHAVPLAAAEPIYDPGLGDFDPDRPYYLAGLKSWETIHIPDNHNHASRSILLIPLSFPKGLLTPVGNLAIGTSSSSSFTKTEHDTACVLAVTLTVALLRGGSTTHQTAARGLAEMLAEMRHSLKLTVPTVAERAGVDAWKLAIWENGGNDWPSASEAIQWCRGLGLFAAPHQPVVTLCDVTPSLLALLREDPRALSHLTPEVFERLVANRLDQMGFNVTLTGDTFSRDGGVDFIAVPRHLASGTHLLAGQVKHHRGHQRATRADVDRLLSWKNSVFRLGMLVTNTTFTGDARWIAAQNDNQSFLRLRDFEDIKRWIEGNFMNAAEVREIPGPIELAPGIRVSIPKAELALTADRLPAWQVTQHT